MTYDIIFNVYCDGGSRGNPGPAASAFIVKDALGQVVHQQGYYLGTSTNNQAEYQAVIESIKWIASNLISQYPTIEINFYLDSLLVVNQLNGLYKIKDENLKSKYLEIKKFIEIRTTKTSFNFVPRNQNSSADKLVNETLDKIFF